jgi:signal transduction histidine kinase
LRAPGTRVARLLWSLRDITRRKRIERRLKESEEQYRSLYRRMASQRDALRVLSHRYLHAREEEAQRIAHQLHDEAGQVTASIHLALDEIARELPRRGRMRVRQAKGYLDDVEERLRRLSHELRPTILDDLGLIPALEFLAEGFSARSGVTLRVSGSTGGRIDPVVETAIYRIVQEALANVARHACATEASIRLQRRRDVLRCRVEDDGVGFGTASAPAAPRSGLGLLGVRERLDALGGSLRIQSRPGRGVRLSIAVPLRRKP